MAKRTKQSEHEDASQRVRVGRVFGGTALIVSSLIILVSLVSYDPADPPGEAYSVGSQIANRCGIVGAWLSGLLVDYLGLVTPYVLVVLGIVWIYLFFSRRELEHPLLKIFGICCFLVSSSTLFGWNYIRCGCPPGAHLPGGVIGQVVAKVFVNYFASSGALILILAFGVLSLFLATDMLVWNIIVRMAMLLRGGWRRLRRHDTSPRLSPTRQSAGADVSKDEAVEPDDADTLPRRATVGLVEPPLEDQQDEVDEEEFRPGHVISAESLEESASEIEVPDFDGADEAEASDYQLPGIELLDEAAETDPSKYEAIVREKAIVLERCLGEFGIRVRVVAIETGPVITMYELELAPGIKVGRLLGLTDDIAMALKAPSVRIVAPIPGKSTVGVEVPNLDKENVRLHEVMSEFSGNERKLGIPVYIGKDAGGAPLVFDLTQLPHLLIAGETGSGKSVCIGALILSILMTRRPDEVRLLLVDPKMVEFQDFRGVPHLMSPVVTDMKKAAGIMQWAEKKMDQRYEGLAALNVRNIRSYNALGEAEIRKRLGISPDEPTSSIEIPFKLPYIVIVIDELADLMMLAAKEIETSIIRLAQKSRAVGIHIVLATQRPSVDVITGLIKSNMPARITFRLLSKVDSRTILDQNGAEKLLGRGDMLFLQPGTSKIVRAQGTYVMDEEIRRVVGFLKDQARPDYHPELADETSMPTLFSGSKSDGLYEEAVKIVVFNHRGSVSLLQRKLEIGYSRAARLIDMMAEDGIVGPHKGSQAREVVMNSEAWEEWRASRSGKKKQQ